MKTRIKTATVFGLTILLTACASNNGAKRVLLPLDHGPRAQTTPWENKQRLLRTQRESQPKEKTDTTSQDANK